jgi:His/Glu/Gln/Arg/opine family amino acid ABC transporter permease subunit
MNTLISEDASPGDITARQRQPSKGLTSGALATAVIVLATAGMAAAGCAVVVVPIVYAIADLSPQAGCVAQFGEAAVGAVGTCRIAAAFKSDAATALCAFAIVAGALCALTGFGSYRRMLTKETRRRAFAGGVIGLQAALLAVGLLWFRAGDVETFAYQFLNFTALHGHFGAFLTGARNTVFLAVIGEAGGLLLGLGLALATMSEYRSVRTPARAYINFFRGTPLIWQLSFIYFGFALGLKLPLDAFQAAILTFCLNIGAYSAEVLRAGIQSVERGQMEAARGLGFTYFGAMRYAILPQAFRRVIPPLLNEFVGLIKDTSLIIVLGLTAGQQDLFTTAQNGYSESFNASFFIAAALGYLAITLPLIRLVNWAEARMRSGLSGIAVPG